MESNKQEKKNLLNDNPIASHGSWISKHSIAAGSPVHLGGSGKSPLYQRTGVLDNSNVQDISSKDTGADIYKLPEVPGPGGSSEAFAVVQDRRPESKPRYTPGQLAQRVDVKTGKPLGFNRTSGTVEMSGGNAPSDRKRYKNVNLDNSTRENPGSSSEARQLKANTKNQVKVTNREYDTDTWSNRTRSENLGQTKLSPQQTYKKQTQGFDKKRKNDSIRTMRNRNFAATNLELEGKGKRLSNTVTKEQLLNFMKAKK